MSRCLQDQALLLLYEDEGTRTQRAHLEVCKACARRYQRLVRDLEVIGRVLQEAPLPRAVPHHRHFLPIRWMPVAAALAIMLTLMWGGLWMRSPSPPVLSAETGNQAIFLFLDEVSNALFSTAGASGAVIPSPVSNLTYLQAALEGEWPCEWQDSFFTPECNDNSFSLLFEG